MAEEKLNINIDAPRYDQSTYGGRARHFFITTNPLNLFVSGKALDNAKDIVERHRKGEITKGLTEDKLWEAKNLYDSAFHPDTKEKMFIIGRMSAQVPMNMTITGCMMTFYKSTPTVIFWQWMNQTFNAVVNYTNRSGSTPVSKSQLGVSYVLATGGAVTTALSLNHVVKTLPAIVGRMVPFSAVAAANCINIPLMRSSELMEGIELVDKNDNPIGESKIAAKKAIGQVVVSRVIMAMPGMMIPPFIMNALEKKPFLQRNPRMNAPIQIGLIGCLLIFATPLCCALFPQKSSIAVSSLEPELQKKIKAMPNAPDIVFYNKGL